MMSGFYNRRQYTVYPQLERQIRFSLTLIHTAPGTFQLNQTPAAEIAKYRES
jgi:hypothetical protein